MEVRRSRELEELMEEARAARARGDDNWFHERTAPGEAVMFGTAPDEVTRGHDEIIGGPKIADYEQAHEGAGIKLVQGHSEAYETEHAGWAITDTPIELNDGTHVPGRNVTIFVRDREGQWLMAASFLSVVVSDDLLTPGSPIAQAAASATDQAGH